MRSGANQSEIVVDPTTWSPIRTREVTQGSVTEVRFVGFDQPMTIDPPESCSFPRGGLAGSASAQGG